MVEGGRRHRRPGRAAVRGVHRQGRLRGAVAGRRRPDRDPGRRRATRSTWARGWPSSTAMPPPPRRRPRHEPPAAAPAPGPGRSRRRRLRLPAPPCPGPAPAAAPHRHRQVATPRRRRCPTSRCRPRRPAAADDPGRRGACRAGAEAAGRPARRRPGPAALAGGAQAAGRARARPGRPSGAPGWADGSPAADVQAVIDGRTARRPSVPSIAARPRPAPRGPGCTGGSAPCRRRHPPPAPAVGRTVARGPATATRWSPSPTSAGARPSTWSARRRPRPTP